MLEKECHVHLVVTTTLKEGNWQFSSHDHLERRKLTIKLITRAMIYLVLTLSQTLAKHFSTLHTIFQHLKCHSIGLWSLLFVMRGRSFIILIKILLCVMYLLSLTDFITLFLFFCSVCVSVICCFNSLFIFSVWSLLNPLDLCVDFFFKLNLQNVLANIFLFLLIFPLVLWNSRCTC